MLNKTVWFGITIEILLVSAFFIALTTGCSSMDGPTIPPADRTGNPSISNDISTGTGELPSAGGSPTLYSTSNRPLYYPDEVLVLFHEDRIKPGLLNLQTQPLSLVEEIRCRWGTVYEYAITDGTSVEDMVEMLNDAPEVRIAEPNYILYFDDAPYFPNDPMWAYKSDPNDPFDSPYDQWGPSMIGASVVWNETKGRDGVVVAVMDTGVRNDHIDLADNVWINEDEIPDNGEDDDMNGYIDDWWGWDAWYNNNNPFDDGYYAGYHGSACSGVVAAVQDNAIGLTGVAPGVKVMALKVDLTGMGGLESTVVEAMNYAAVNRADIVSMSFGTTAYSGLMEIACEDAWDNGHGTILMASAGNDSSTAYKYPTGYECVMTIGATVPWSDYLNPMDEKRITSGQDGYWWGSNYGSHLSVMGYGAQYSTTYGGNSTGFRDGLGNDFFGGTSCACPMSAGVMALVKSAFPTKTPLWLWQRLEETADDLDSPGFDIQTGHGRVNAMRAVFGPDRYEDLEDIQGFVPLTLPDAQAADSIHDVPDNPYRDTEDLYSFTANELGWYIVTMNIFTWGEDLDLELYSHEDMLNMLDSSTIDNHYNSSFEMVSVNNLVPGKEYYVRVLSHENGSSTSYSLDIIHSTNNLTVTGVSIAPASVAPETESVPFLKLTFEIEYEATLDGLNISKSGTLPNDSFGPVYIYGDSNHNGDYDAGDVLVSQETTSQLNRVEFSDLNIHWDNRDPIVLFVAAYVVTVTGSETIAMSLESYKDVVTEEGAEAHYSQFPIMSGEVSVE